MARSWLEVTTDEVHSKQGAAERLAERRRAIAERAQHCVEQIVAPAFENAARTFGDREYRQDYDTEWSVVRCGLYGLGAAERDPTAAFHIVEFDAYQPLVILRRKAHGAGQRPEARTLRVERLDAETLAAFLNAEA